MRYTEAPARRAELLRRVGDAGYISAIDVAAQLGVSAMTIRRDLRDLAADGLVNRVAGGASVVSGAPFEQRRGAATSEKDAVARAAVALLAGSSVVCLDAGTTVAALVAHLPGELTVLTHSVPVIVACTGREDIDLIALGGSYDPATRSFTGPLTRAGLDNFAADVAVLSATAAGESGVYSAHASDADTKRAMAAIADRIVLLLDHGKLEARAPMKVMDLVSVDTVVVDAGVTREQLRMLRKRCRQVVVAPEGTAR